jgi:UDP-N-acetylmuramoyl-L-alanyl-D-glutamate--2,6-diaminopimelate ligase
VTTPSREPHAWRLADLLDGICAAELSGGAVGERLVSALTLDSRTTVPGALFFACRGTALHGLAFADEAARRGAAVVLAEPAADWPARALTQVQARTGVPILGVPDLPTRIGRIADRFYGEPSAGIPVFGVAGRDGKTTATHLLAQTLAPELRCGVLSTLGSGFPGEPTASHGARDAAALHAALAGLRRQGATAIAVEVSSPAMDGCQAQGVRFSHAVLTHLRREGLNPRGDVAAYGDVERQLFRTQGLSWAVLNLDDPLHGQVLGDLAPGAQVAGYSLQADVRPPSRCDLWVRAAALHARPAGLEIRVETSRGEGTLRAPLLGTFNGANLLAVLAVLMSRGTALEEALPALAQVRAVPGRMEPFGGDGAPLVVVDSARTPDALEKALTSLRLHGCRSVISVVGCGGDRDRGKRPLMGAIAERLSDALILTDDNPRTESGDAIVAQILEGVSRPDAIRVVRQRGLAIRRAIAIAGRGDAVLVAGKGHETTQDLGDLKVHFSDRAQVVEALREWREGHH